MRRNALIMALAVLLIAGVVANFSLGSSTHIRDEITLQPGGIASEFIPGGHSVRGRVSANCSFTLYLAPPDPNRFGDFDIDSPLMMWPNVREVSLDFNVTDDSYLVVSEGNCSTKVEIDITTSPISH